MREVKKILMKEKMTPSRMIENHTLAETPCQGCGKSITVAVPFSGCPFCSDCIAPQSWSLGTEDFIHNESSEKIPE